ncbi:primary-amine oxidase [Anthocerotibacter panamensis]|uniref:primary-amine oxidase n=1 Tax=Anthocerotibacter panamensis TaxID=2857077 RepID=UPI001C405E35|nr:primary-amine oxidase [Anthocerotibacter panamensis]
MIHDAKHPLDPLSAEELSAAVLLVRREKSLDAQFRFASVALHEPPKSVVRQFQPGDPIDREAFVILLDKTTGTTYQAVVSLTQKTLHSWKPIPGVQPRIMGEELVACEQVVKAHPEFQEALARRGITDLDLVMVDPWAGGHYGFEEEQGVRLARALCWLRDCPTGNAYARPLDGLVPVVDLNRMAVLRVEDHGLVSIPPHPGNYTGEFVKPRAPLKPLEIVQPEGSSFEVTGYAVRWQRWQLRVGFTPREGVVLHTLGYEDQGRVRPILYRASLAEMVVPYGDPRPQHFRKNAFDLGEHGVGMLTNSLKLGCDCLGEIYYFDAWVCDSHGEVVSIPQAICLHEEDHGILWKHTDWRRNHAEVRRSRRLVLSFVATVDNYDYGFYWYFYQDGTIQYEAKLTGILLTGTALDEEQPHYGTLVAPRVNALNHQHFFGMRLDMSVDGEHNSVYEVNTEAQPAGPDNPQGNAFFAQSTLLATESEAQRLINPLSARSWNIVNPCVLNSLGQPVAYKLIPGENVLPFAHPDSSILKRAGFLTKHLWVTPYEPEEHYPAGDYPNQHPGGEGLPRWTQANRPLENTDLVVWYNFGHHHLPRPEDWPVMPVAHIGFLLKPTGFFDRNPALDVPPSGKHCHS